MEQEVDLRTILGAFKRNWLTVLLIPLAMVIVTTLILFRSDQPQYSASATLLVLDIVAPEQPLNQDTGAAGRLYTTYAEIVTSKRILNRVIADLNLNLTAEQLQKKTSVSYLGDSNVMVVNVDDREPRRAARIANQIAQTYILEINNLIEGKEVSLLDEAAIPQSPHQTCKTSKIIAAAAAGLIAAAGLVFIREFFIPTLKEPQEKGD